MGVVSSQGSCQARISPALANLPMPAAPRQHRSPLGATAGCRDVGPAHSLSCSESLTQGTQSSLLPEGPQCLRPQKVLVLHLDSTVWTIPAASVADQLQHLLRIYYLLPGFASSFPSCHFGSIYLLPVREGNRTDPWGDGERQD